MKETEWFKLKRGQLSSIKETVHQNFGSLIFERSLNSHLVLTGVIPISLFMLATGTVLRKAAIAQGIRLGCRYRGVTS